MFFAFTNINDLSDNQKADMTGQMDSAGNAQRSADQTALPMSAMRDSMTAVWTSGSARKKQHHIA